MSNIRLLPVVIFATATLLLFKAVGIVTGGGYVLGGAEAVLAASGGGGHGAETAPAADPGDGSHTLAADPTLTDTSPTLADTAPVLGAKADGHGASPSHDDGHAAAAEADHGATSEPAEHAADAPALDSPPGTPMLDIGGERRPLLPVVGSEAEILTRLAERRQELDAREDDLDARTALLLAAEKRLDEKAAQLAATEQRINALVADKQAAEDAAFQALVGMYETMKPKEAAAIFDALDEATLVRVARAMSPKKMAPILARMAPARATQLTEALALMPRVTNASANAAPALEQLPQIVGQ